MSGAELAWSGIAATAGILLLALLPLVVLRGRRRRGWGRTVVVLDRYAREGVLHRETVRGSITYRDHHGPAYGEHDPDLYSSWARVPLRGELLLTRERLLLAGDRGVLVQVPWRDRRFAALAIDLDEHRLRIRLRTEVFRTDARGGVEIRLRCHDAAAVLRLIQDRRIRRT